MTKYIERIFLPSNTPENSININLHGKNLIITGKNGSGKTLLIKSIFSKTEILISKKGLIELPGAERTLKQLQAALDTKSEAVTEYDLINAIRATKEKVESINSGIQISIPNHAEYLSRLVSKTSILRMFEAMRTAKINHAESVHGIDSDKEKHRSEKIDSNFGSNLEQHLVNLKIRRLLAEKEGDNDELLKKIDSWFILFEQNLAELMEDPSTRLVFDSNKLKFKISQRGKVPYTFQTLSSGYSSILDVYADLMMRTEYFETTPKDLTGVVFIDEIDAHLHVSLQRLIFPFFEKSFPNVQFIVTTHSPFVLMSVNDAVIYDRSRNAQIDEDLSLYSYSAVMEGILGTKPTSRLLDDLILEISNISNSQDRNYSRLKELLDQIHPLEDKLDVKSKAFYLTGKNALLDKEEE